jgi:hypothetical protein
MPETIIVQYRLTKDLWHRFFEAHYSCDRSLKLRWVWGAACVVIGCLGFAGFYPSRVVAALLLATGLFGVLSKHLLVAKSMRTARRHPFFGQDLTVSVSAEELSVRSGNSGYAQPWRNFAGYRRLASGFLLYHDHNAFFFIPAEALTAGYARRLEEILEGAGVSRW